MLLRCCYGVYPLRSLRSLRSLPIFEPTTMRHPKKTGRMSSAMSRKTAQAAAELSTDLSSEDDGILHSDPDFVSALPDSSGSDEPDEPDQHVQLIGDDAAGVGNLLGIPNTPKAANKGPLCSAYTQKGDRCRNIAVPSSPGPLLCKLHKKQKSKLALEPTDKGFPPMPGKRRKTNRSCGSWSHTRDL